MDVPIASKEGCAVRIGIEMFGTQTESRLRGIGRYAHHLVSAMVARDPVNEYLLYAESGRPVDQVPTGPNVTILSLKPDPGRGESTLADALRRRIATNLDRLDVFLLISPLELAPGYDTPIKPLNGLKMATVVHDLIPFLFHDRYLSDAAVARGYYLRLARLKQYDVLLANSEATRTDCVTHLGMPPDRVVTIGTASDGRFFVPDRSGPPAEEARAVLRRQGIERPFVFAVGSMEHRKDPRRVLDAFALLPEGIRRSHQLVMTYAPAPSQVEELRAYARDLGIDGSLVLTGRLEDSELRVLYQRCAVFTFPSLYEGFGLPILEALHCGAPVVAGNNSSQVEVVGEAGLLANVGDPGDIAAKLLRLLTDRPLARNFREIGPVQAARFSWDRTAESALAVLSRIGETRSSGSPVRCDRPRRSRPRIAYFSPFPPKQSGISTYSMRLIEGLKRHYTIDLYHDAGYVPEVGLRSHEFACHDFRLFRRYAPHRNYRGVVYQMGNSSFHKFIYETAQRYPGIVTLHDFSLAEFQYWNAMVHGRGLSDLLAEIEHAHPQQASAVGPRLEEWSKTPRGVVSGCAREGLWLNRRIFEWAEAVVVHSPWGRAMTQRLYPDLSPEVRVVPHGAQPSTRSPEEKAAIRTRIDLPAEALIVASFGIVHPTKMNIEAFLAFEPLARALPEAVFLVVGAELDDGQARRALRELGLGSRVRLLGPQPDAEFEDLVAVTDLGISLRRPPTGGETSGALLDLLRAGVATIVTDVGTFADYPDDVVRKVRWDDQGPESLRQALFDLASDRPAREALGRAALAYVRERHDWSRAADLYAEVIERTHRAKSAGRSAPSRYAGPHRRRALLGADLPSSSWSVDPS